MSRTRPLLEEEVPVAYRDKIDFNSFKIVDVPQVRRAHKKYTVVDVFCSVCQERKTTAVNDIRNWIRGSKKNFPGTHRKCKYEGRYMTKEGYVLIYKPDHPNAYTKGYVLEHVFVMSESLNRPIDTTLESVHHIDGNSSNNELSNLQLRKAYHGKGQAWKCLDCGGHNIKAVTLD